MMPTTIELAPDQFRDFSRTQAEELETPPPPKPSTVLASTIEDTKWDRATQPRHMSPPVLHRLVTTGPEGAMLELPMQANLARQPNLWLETPETVEGLRFRLFIAEKKTHATIKVSAEYVGLPISTVLSYVRFLRSLYSEEGKLTFTVFKPKQKTFDVAYLPLLSGDAAKAQLDATIRFVEDVARVGEATGMTFVYPSELTGEDVLAAQRASDIVRTGWTTETVQELRLTPTPQGARVLLAQGVDADITLALDGEGTSVSVAGQEVDLGPSIHWIERVRMVTPPASVLDWLDSGPGPNDRMEIRLVPVGAVRLHSFFPEWPKASLERLQSSLETFELKYGKPSEEFAAAWRKGEEWARQIEGGSMWMSLIRATEASL